MHDEICYASAFELAWNIRSRAVSPVEVITAHLERIEALNASVNAVVTVPDGLLDLAREAETALMRGNIWGPLHGVPFTVKDCFDTQGVRTTRGSRLFENRIPMYDSTAALRLKEAGALLLGKTNLPEFALRSETSNLVFGTTRNPWNKEKTCGGSSGGEATAIACGFSPLGIGSDLGGSNRLPSHYCGVVGLKPTHGRIPMTGHWPELLLRYMHAGPIARTVRDVALVLPILNGPDNRDPYGLSVRSPRFEDLRAPLPPLRVGWFDCGPFDPVDPEIREAVRRAASVLQELGCRLEEVSFPHWKEPSPIDATMMLVFGEGIHYLNPFVKKRRRQLSPSIRALMRTSSPSLDEYLKTIDYCEQLRRDITQFFSEYELLLLPTSPVPAHDHDAEELEVDGQMVPPTHSAAATAVFGLTGSPAVSVPFSYSQSGLPIGVQLVARHFHESTLLHAASALEVSSVTGLRQPPL